MRKIKSSGKKILSTQNMGSGVAIFHYSQMMQKGIQDEIKYRLIDDVIAEVTFNKFHYVLLGLCGLGFCVDAMEVVSLSFINPCAGAEFALKDNQIAVRVHLCDLCGAGIYLLCMSFFCSVVFSMQVSLRKCLVFSPPFYMHTNMTNRLQFV